MLRKYTWMCEFSTNIYSSFFSPCLHQLHLYVPHTYNSFIHFFFATNKQTNKINKKTTCSRQTFSSRVRQSLNTNLCALYIYICHIESGHCSCNLYLDICEINTNTHIFRDTTTSSFSLSQYDPHQRVHF